MSILKPVSIWCSALISKWAKKNNNHLASVKNSSPIYCQTLTRTFLLWYPSKCPWKCSTNGNFYKQTHNKSVFLHCWPSKQKPDKISGMRQIIFMRQPESRFIRHSDSHSCHTCRREESDHKDKWLKTASVAYEDWLLWAVWCRCVVLPVWYPAGSLPRQITSHGVAPDKSLVQILARSPNAETALKIQQTEKQTKAAGATINTQSSSPCQTHEIKKRRHQARVAEGKQFSDRQSLKWRSCKAATLIAVT